jgi:hypothetical protein
MAQTPIANFISNFDGGARSNLFEIEFTSPGLVIEGNNSAQGGAIKVYAKATEIPSTTLGQIPVNYMGRVVNIPGDRVYNDWTVTILADENMNIRAAFENWNLQFNSHFNNTPIQTGAGAGHMQLLLNSSAIVRHLKRDHTQSLAWTLRHLWCEDVQSVPLSYDNNDALAEFQVTLKYHGLERA